MCECVYDSYYYLRETGARSALYRRKFRHRTRYVSPCSRVVHPDSRAMTPTPLALRLARSSVHRPMPLDTGTDTGTDADRLRLRRCHLPSPVPRLSSLVPRPPSPVPRLTSHVSRLASRVSRLASRVSRLSSLVSPDRRRPAAESSPLHMRGRRRLEQQKREKILLFHSFRASLRVHFITIYSIDDTSLREPKSPAHESEPA